MSAPTPIVIRRMAPGEELAVSALVATAFRQDVAPLYAPEGVTEFLRYATETGLRDRQAQGHIVLVAVQGDLLVGMIEIREGRHISLLFVDPDRQRQGIGRELVRESLDLSRRLPLPPAEITVNAAPNALEAYRRLGFRAIGDLQVSNGIGFVPMSLELGRADGA